MTSAKQGETRSPGPPRPTSRPPTSTPLRLHKHAQSFLRLAPHTRLPANRPGHASPSRLVGRARTPIWLHRHAQNGLAKSREISRNLAKSSGSRNPHPPICVHASLLVWSGAHPIEEVKGPPALVGAEDEALRLVPCNGQQIFCFFFAIFLGNFFGSAPARPLLLLQHLKPRSSSSAKKQQKKKKRRRLRRRQSLV